MIETFGLEEVMFTGVETFENVLPSVPIANKEHNPHPIPHIRTKSSSFKDVEVYYKVFAMKRTLHFVFIQVGQIIAFMFVLVKDVTPYLFNVMLKS